MRESALAGFADLAEATSLPVPVAVKRPFGVARQFYRRERRVWAVMVNRGLYFGERLGAPCRIKRADFYGVLPQPSQGTDWVHGQRNHDDRHLLTPFGQRSQQTLLAFRAPDPKLLVTQIELVKSQFHITSSTGLIGEPPHILDLVFRRIGGSVPTSH